MTNQEFKTQIDEITKILKAIKEKYDITFNKKLDEIDIETISIKNSLKEIENKLDVNNTTSIQKSIDSLNQLFVDINKKIELIEGGSSEIEAKLNVINEKVNNLEISKIATSNQINAIREEFQKNEKLLNEKNRKLENEINQLKGRISQKDNPLFLIFTLLVLFIFGYLFFSLNQKMNLLSNENSKYETELKQLKEGIKNLEKIAPIVESPQKNITSIPKFKNDEEMINYMINNPNDKLNKELSNKMPQKINVIIKNKSEIISKDIFFEKMNKNFYKNLKLIHIGRNENLITGYTFE